MKKNSDKIGPRKFDKLTDLDIMEHHYGDTTSFIGPARELWELMKRSNPEPRTYKVYEEWYSRTFTKLGKVLE